MLYQLGGMPVMAGLPFGPKAKYYFVDPANGNDSNPGTDLSKPMASIEAAEARCVANQNDTVFYIGGSSSDSLTAALTWDKNYTHLIGICAPSHVGQRARIFQTATLTGASPLLNVTASGCIFKNFYIFQGVDDATSLINVQVTGERNYFENVHFAGGGHATQAINGGASLKINGGSENRFVHCTVGVDTADAATGMVALLFDAAATRNLFEDCLFTIEAGNAGAGFVEVADNAALGRYTLFRRCSFLNPNANQFTMAAAFLIGAQTASRPNHIFLQDCMSYGATTWDANDRGILMGNMSAVTGADLSGAAVEMVT